MFYTPHTQNLIARAEKSCTGCGKCMKNCPMLDHFCTSPKKLLAFLDAATPADKDEVKSIAFTCTLCDYCTHVCPCAIDLKDVFLNIKKDYVTAFGYPGEFGKAALSFHQASGFSPLFSTQIINRKHAKTILFPGCSIAADDPDVIEHVLGYLNTLCPTETFMKCCANPTRSVGMTQQFNAYKAQLQQDFDRMGTEEIIVLCVNCYNTLTHMLPNMTVRTLWEVIAQEGLPPALKKTDLPFKVALHDPCPTRKLPHVHQAVRHVLSELGIQADEFEDTREETACCGSGAMLGLINPSLARQHMSRRAGQSPQDHILTYCQECVESLSTDDKQTLHLLSLLFPHEKTIGPHKRRKPPLQKWSNRFKTKLNTSPRFRLSRK